MRPLPPAPFYLAVGHPRGLGRIGLVPSALGRCRTTRGGGEGSYIPSPNRPGMTFYLIQFGTQMRFRTECMISNNHSGRWNACVALTPIRVVCANTLGYAERRGDQGVDRMIKVSHTGDAATKMVGAASTLLADLIERFEAVATQYRRLKATHLPETAFTKLVLDEVAPDPRNRPDFNPEARTAELVLNRAERKRAELRRLWDEGAGHTGDRSAWEAYNAAAEAIDHNAELWPNRAGAYRTASLMDGNLLRLKQNVLANLSRYAPDRKSVV